MARAVEDKVCFIGTFEEIRHESAKRFCKAFGIRHKYAYLHVNCPTKPMDIMFVGVKNNFSPFDWTREAIGTFFQIRQSIGGSHHIIAYNYSSGCLDPNDNELFTVLDWNDCN